MIRPIVNPVPSRVDPAPRQRKKRSVKKYDVVRMMAAARQGGLEIASVEIGADGSIRLSSSNTASAKALDEFERWEGRL